MSEDRLYNVETVGQKLDMSSREVYAAAADGQLGPVVKIGRRVRFKAEVIDRIASGIPYRATLAPGKSGQSATK